MVCLIIAPALMMAGAYLILGSVIRRLGFVLQSCIVVGSAEIEADLLSVFALPG